MEERIGQITPPVPAAGMDPAAIPGITAPEPGAADAAGGAGEAEGSAERPSGVPGAEPATGAAEDSGEPGTVEEEAEEDEEAEEGDGEEAEEDDGTGPVFEVHDHRGSILAGRSGVTFRLDGEEARFDWDEIGAVQIDLPRFGRRFSVTVHTVARRWYDAEVLAPSRSALREWEERLDAVLDAYFEESSSKDGTEGETEEAPGEDTAAGA
ncbi:hypothetical protein ACFSJS_07900 [Streptomyces desertarenae]|uniref:Uncharacterized protein n=1 Tax=Streptomyces desertarenae TaxID=2666184 RepID=A0ABW4PH46_9ACTN